MRWCRVNFALLQFLPLFVINSSSSLSLSFVSEIQNPSFSAPDQLIMAQNSLFGFLLLLVLVPPQLTASRPLNGVFLSGEPSFNIALPREGEAAVPPPPLRSSVQQILVDNYKSLFLNILPRGTQPPAGPDPGIDGDKH